MATINIFPIKWFGDRNASAIFGKTWNIPFGSLGKEQKKELGKKSKSFIILSILIKYGKM